MAEAWKQDHSEYNGEEKNFLHQSGFSARCSKSVNSEGRSRIEQTAQENACACMLHTCIYVHAHTNTKHKFFANLVLNNSTATPCEYAVHSVCLSEHGAKCQ